MTVVLCGACARQTFNAWCVHAADARRARSVVVRFEARWANLTCLRAYNAWLGMCAERARLRRVVGSALGRMTNGKLAAGLLVWRVATAAAREAAMHEWLVEEKVWNSATPSVSFALCMLFSFGLDRVAHFSVAIVSPSWKKRSSSVSVSRCLLGSRSAVVFGSALKAVSGSATPLAGLARRSSRLSVRCFSISIGAPGGAGGAMNVPRS